jgi:transcription initiation factor TFIIIB Brf1 subunit/transcription initiation factor TFIIB
MSDDKDWKDLFSSTKTFYSQRKSSYQSVFDNIVGSHLFDNLTIDSANLLFTKVYDPKNPRKLKRGNSRKCVAFACMYYACIMHGHPYTMDELCTLLNVARKQATTGIKFFTFHIPDDMRYVLKSDDDIYTLKQLMRDHHIAESEQRMVEHLYSYIKLHTNICARSRSRSIILTILLIVFEFTQEVVDKKVYIDRVKMSELTIGKIYKVVKQIITCDEELLKQLNQIKTIDSKYVSTAEDMPVSVSKIN